MKSERKRMLTMEALATGRMVGVAFAPGADGVVVPDHLKEEVAVILDFGRRAPTPIEDLVCDAEGISGTLRFGDEFIWCSIPWAAVVAIAPHGPTPVQRAWNPTVLQGGKSNGTSN